MPIHRSGPTPQYYEYICDHVLIPNTSPPSPQLLALIAPGGHLNWVDIPRFQRGISWDLDNIRDLFQSTSILLGNVILAQFDRNITPPTIQFPNLQLDQNKYMILIDGLQRFAVGTAILSTLHSEVLSPTPNRPGDAPYFAALAARVTPFSAIYLHNDVELLNHPRQAIQEQYSGLKRSIQGYFETEFNRGRGAILGTSIVMTFLSRQVALDLYFGFNRTELLNTFIGINTIRVELGPIDILRAQILERATSIAWPESDIEDVENNFTDIFTLDQKPKQYLLPFVNACLKCIENGNGSRLFPSWSSGLLKTEVDTFLDFVDTFELSRTNNFLKEIFECGKLPVSLILAHYYKELLHGTRTSPSFFTGGILEDSELHSFLICSYRLLLDGTVGRTTEYLEQTVDGRLNLNLSQLSDRISYDYLGCLIADPLDAQWLETTLNGVDKKKAQRVFNAMLLPIKTSLGSLYHPITFGRSSLDFHIDHLIPFTLIAQHSPGGPEAETLRNFAPLPSNQNRVAKATNCSNKLSTGGVYHAYLAGTTHYHHPYCDWLVTVNAPLFSSVELNDQSKLERNTTPDIGTTRIQFIAIDLLTRI